jgi:hypothetical protein
MRLAKRGAAGVWVGFGAADMQALATGHGKATIAATARKNATGFLDYHQKN